MSDAAGVYRARCIALGPAKPGGGNDGVVVVIPNLFGTVEVPVTQFLGVMPKPSDYGWVAFEAADSDYPVWLGTTSI